MRRLKSLVVLSLCALLPLTAVATARAQDIPAMGVLLSAPKSAAQPTGTPSALETAAPSPQTPNPRQTATSSAAATTASTASIDVLVPTPIATVAPTISSKPGWSEYRQELDCRAYNLLYTLNGFSLLYPNDFEVRTCQEFGLFYVWFVGYKDKNQKVASSVSELIGIASFPVLPPFKDNYPGVAAGLLLIGLGLVNDSNPDIVTTQPFPYKGGQAERVDFITDTTEGVITRLVLVPSAETQSAMVLLWAKRVDIPSRASFQEADIGIFKTILDSLDMSQATVSDPPTPAPTPTTLSHNP